MNTAINYLLNKQYSGHVWCFLFVITVIWSGVSSWNLASSIDKGFRFLVIDKETFVLPRSYEFTEANSLHREQAALAAETLFLRNPNDIDNRNRLKALFHPIAYEDANEHIQNENPVFQEKSFHQKVSVKDTSLMVMNDSSVRAVVTGQLIRVGNFLGKPFVEVLDFELRLLFKFNESMMSNGMFPTLVHRFELKTQPST